MYQKFLGAHPLEQIEPVQPCPETLAAKRFHPARSIAASRWPPRQTLRKRWWRRFGAEDFSDDGLGCGHEKLALLVTGEIDDAHDRSPLAIGWVTKFSKNRQGAVRTDRESDRNERE